MNNDRGISVHGPFLLLVSAGNDIADDLRTGRLGARGARHRTAEEAQMIEAVAITVLLTIGSLILILLWEVWK